MERPVDVRHTLDIYVRINPRGRKTKSCNGLLGRERFQRAARKIDTSRAQT